MTNEFDKLAALLTKAIGQSKRLLKQFKIAPRTKLNKRFALIVLNEIIRKSESVEAMARAAAFSGINIVTRAAFENHMDLLNLFKYKDDYPNYMIYASFNQQRSFLQPVATAEVDSEFVNSFEDGAKRTAGQSPKEMLVWTRKQMAEIEDGLPDTFKDRNEGVITRDIFKFQLADKMSDYNIGYRHLSSSAHGRLSAMLEGVMDGEDIQWPPTDPINRPLVAIDCQCAIIIGSSGLMAKKFNKPDAPFKALAKEKQKIVDDYNC